MKRLVVNADDFGLTAGVNRAIVYAHKNGILTSATLMVNMPAAGAAYEIARRTPSLGVGIHINLTSGRPLSDQVPSLTGPGGAFLKLLDLRERAAPEDLEREILAQVEAFLAAGLRPTHLDSHHHVHLEVAAVGQIVAAAAARLGVPVRDMGGAPEFIDRFYGRGQVGADRLVAILAGLQPGSVAELMCHPAYVDPELRALSSYSLERLQELDALIAPAVRAAVREHGISLVSYRDLS